MLNGINITKYETICMRYKTKNHIFYCQYSWAKCFDNNRCYTYLKHRLLYIIIRPYHDEGTLLDIQATFKVCPKTKTSMHFCKKFALCLFLVGARRATDLSNASFVSQPELACVLCDNNIWRLAQSSSFYGKVSAFFYFAECGLENQATWYLNF